MTDDTAKNRQETLRDTMLGAARRWRFMQETMAWAAAQPGVSRCTPKACIERQTRLLASLGDTGKDADATSNSARTFASRE